MSPKLLIVYPNLPLMMAPAISVVIFNALAKNQGCQVRLFETTEYSDTYSNRHIRMTEYQQEFFGDIQQGGADRIKQRYCLKHDATGTYNYELY